MRQQVDTWDCSPAPQPIYYTDITPRTVQVTETVNTLQQHEIFIFVLKY